MISKFLRTNVLAIRCVDNLVLVGMGSMLYIFAKDSYQLKNTLDCLYPNNIHGIVLGPNNKLAVFGAKSVCICIPKEEETIFKKQSTHQFDDWIIAIEWISVKEQAQLAILFAHNYICIYNEFDDSSRFVYCKERCILYGGSMSGTSEENLIIFSGTVFQEILIWKIDNNPDNNENMPVLHRLTGHKGVIFSVIYCPYLQLVCSTSDDRTVRLWKVIKRNNPKDSDINWQTAEIILMKTMFSHTARVWRAVIRNDVIVTIGEDSLICIWSLTGNLLNKIYAHHGAPIWSIDVTKHAEEIFTGGADGSVYIWPTHCCNNSKIFFLSSNDKYNIPKYISYLSSGTILIFNEKGMLLCYNKEETMPKVSLYLEKYCTYCIMQVSPCRSFVALASREGEITVYEEIINANTWRLRQLVEERIMESQIFSLQWLKDNALIACGANGLLRIFNFTIDGTIHVEIQRILPLSRERWLTAAIIYEELLVCGDRAGNVHVFELSDINEEEENMKPIQTFSKVHGKIGVQSFSVIDGKLITTGRDGMLRFYELNNRDEKCLLMLHRKKMPMDWVSNTLTVDKTILVLGFKEVEFMIYDLLHDKILIRVPCGGGHRSWDCMMFDGTASFAYIRNKQVYVSDYVLKSLKLPPILQNGFHTKETFCLRHILKLDAQDIFISGSEDCSLRISCISVSRNDSYAFYNLGIFDGHLSGIKCISTVKLQNASDKLNNKYLIFSGGGRAQLKVWEINFKYNQKISPSIDVSCSDIKSHMLYGQDQYRRKPWQETKQVYIVEPETRYMDIYAYYPSDDLKHVLIFIACADGYLRLFVYDIQTSNIYLKVSTRYVHRCILKIHVLMHKHKIIVLTMTTDGVLRFFDFTDTISKIYKDACTENNVDFNNIPFAEFSLHQSGINSFDLKFINENRYLLITGGDDNLLNLVCFQICISENDKLLSLILSKWNTASAHSAQITGLKFTNENQICSVGIDQQVIIYNYLWHNGALSANIVNKVFTSVTDAQGIDLWSSDNNNDTVCIYGRGFEILSKISQKLSLK